MIIINGLEFNDWALSVHMPFLRQVIMCHYQLDLQEKRALRAEQEATHHIINSEWQGLITLHDLYFNPFGTETRILLQN